MRVAGLQMEVTENVGQNQARIADAVREASRSGVEILLTPEGSLSGYCPSFDMNEVAAALDELTTLASRLHVGLALGTCLRDADGKTYNQLRFHLPDGTYLGFHSKALRCDTLDTPGGGEINDYATTPLRVFDYGERRIGGLICNDMWANPACTPMPDPHLSQQLSRMGATVIFHAVNGGRDGSDWSREVSFPFHEANLRLRARAACVWIVTVDSCFPAQFPCFAPSGVVDPQGNWACRTHPQGDQFFVFDIEDGAECLRS